MKQQNPVLPEVSYVIETITKVANNPKDASHGKKQIELYRRLSEKAIAELKALKYDVKTWTSVSEATSPRDGVYHIITWK